MNHQTKIRAALDVRDQFPAIVGWHYLDSAVSAQKPQAVIDAVTHAYGRDYASVHRGVYQRSADMTLAYEAARTNAANWIGGAAEETIFTRGATEAINLVAARFTNGNRKRVLLSALEHHSNIVPWQLAGYDIDVVPLTEDGRIDLDAAERMANESHAIVSFAHVSNVLGSILDAKRTATIAHQVGAKFLLDGCQAVPRMVVDVADIDCDFYVYSGHKLYGPTGIGCLWGRSDLLNAMPPYQGGGAMIDQVTFAKSTFLDAPARFEAGTPHIVGAIGLHAAIDWTQGAALIERRVRAFNPFPAAASVVAGETVKIWEAAVLPGPLPTGAAHGQILAAGEPGVDVATAEGVLRVTRLQKPGGKALDAAQFLRGFALVPGMLFGPAPEGTP